MIEKIKQKIINGYKWVKSKILFLLIGGVALAAGSQILPTHAIEHITAPENNTYKIGALNYNSILKENITSDQPLKYELDGKYIAFKPIAMKWDKIPLRTVQPSVAMIDKKKHLYKDAFGTGIDIDMNFGERVWEKVVKINSLEDLGKVPRGVEYLEVIYEVETNFIIDGWNKHDDFEITDVTRLGDFSYIEPAMAWDSYSEEVCQQVPVYDDTDTIIEEYVEECETLTNRVKIKSFLSEDKGKFYLTKQIPVEWLKTAEYPIFTDTDVTYGTAQEFSTGNIYGDISVVKIDTDKFVACYRDIYEGNCIAGTVSGTTITFGSEVAFETDLVCGSGIDDFNVCFVNTNKFAVAYIDDTDDDGSTRVGSVDGTAITFGTDTEYNGNNDGEDHYCAGLSADKYVIVFNDETGGDVGSAMACSVSGTTPTCGSAVDLNTSGATIAGSNVVIKNGTQDDEFIACWMYSGQDCAHGSVSGTTITMGSPATPTSDANFAYSYLSSFTTDEFVFLTRKSYNNIMAETATISGSTITFSGVENGVAISGEDYASHNLTALTTDTVFYSFSCGGEPLNQDLYSNIISDINFVTGSLATSTEELVYTGNVQDRNKHWSDLISSGKVAICFSDNEDTYNGHCIIGDVAGAAPPAARRIIITQ